MNVDLFLKKVPQVVKDLIGREAASNRRSINQEAIALLEEALLVRVELAASRRPSAHQVLKTYAATQRDDGSTSVADDTMPRNAEANPDAAPTGDAQTGVASFPVDAAAVERKH